MNIEKLSAEEKLELIQLLEEKERRESGKQFYKYSPYDYQKAFCAASTENKQKALMAANRIGKSDIMAWEVVAHATGEYPEWYEGRKWDRPTLIVCGGKTNQQVKDVAQTKLLGEPSDPSQRGTAFIPASKLGKTARKAGIPDALSSVLVQHISGGWSKISFISYDSGKEGWMGFSADFVALDEEPPQDIYSQALRSTVDRGGVVSLTFTPENGVTDVVRQYQESIKKGQMIMNATWDDAPHITEEVKQQMLDALPPHERKMRSMGQPTLGSGMVFPVAEDDLTCEAFDIPNHWAHVAALDFGYDHPTAWVHLAWDKDEDVVYVVDCYTKSRETPRVHGHNIRARGGKWIPTQYPHDAGIHDKTSGETLKQNYITEGLNMAAECFKNPPDPLTGKSTNGVEAGIMSMLDRMKTGRFQVFEHLDDWLREYRGYYRKDGKIVKVRDDLMDATRYAAMSLRHAMPPNFTYTAYNPAEDDNYEYNDSLIGY